MIDGVAVSRQNLRFEGNPYLLKHYGAHPKPQAVGSATDGGRITGVVCGLDIEYSIEHKPDETRVSGIIENQYQASLSIFSTTNGLAVVGNLGPKGVRLEFSDHHVAGYVGRCPYRMALDPAAQGGDTLVRFVVGNGQKMQVELYGAKSLLQMPQADQAAVLPLVLLCSTEKIFENLGRDSIPAYGFGGQLGAVPSGTLQLGSTIRRLDCGADSYQ